MVVRRKFESLKDAIASVKCPSQKFVKLNIWCSNKGLDLFLTKTDDGMCVVQVLTREEFKRIIFMKKINMLDYDLNTTITSIADNIEMNYSYYIRVVSRAKADFIASTAFPVVVFFSGNVAKYSEGSIYVE